MRQFRLALTIGAVAIATAGCGRRSDVDRSATRVVRPEEVKISLGPDADAKSAKPAEEAAPPAAAAPAP
jgi:hypothetical protein